MWFLGQLEAWPIIGLGVYIWLKTSNEIWFLALFLIASTILNLNFSRHHLSSISSCTTNTK